MLVNLVQYVFLIACSHISQVRNFETQIKKDAATVEAKIKKQEEEETNAMKAMETKLLDTKTEMDTLDMLHEIRTLNAKNSTIDPLDIIDHVLDLSLFLFMSSASLQR